VLTFGLSPVMKLGIRHPRKTERKSATVRAVKFSNSTRGSAFVPMSAVCAAVGYCLSLTNPFLNKAYSKSNVLTATAKVYVVTRAMQPLLSS